MTAQEKIQKLFEDYSAEEIAEKVRKETNLKAYNTANVISDAIDGAIISGIVKNAIDNIYRRCVL